MKSRFSKVDETIRSVVNTAISEKTEERLQLTTHKVKEIISSMKESLHVEISESSKKDITELIKEKKSMLSVSLSERIKEATEIIQVGMKRESDATSDELEKKLSVVKEQLNEVA